MTAVPRRAGRTGRPRPGGLRLPPALVRPGIRQLGRHVLDPALAWEVQRLRFDRLMRTSPVPRAQASPGRCWVACAPRR